MKELSEFRKNAYKMVDWMVDYLENVENHPVMSTVEPNEIFESLPDEMPHQPESLNEIMSDFEKKILPGITHWQSPNFYAYFPANSSPPSILAEMLISTLAIQGMKWITSPASTELEDMMIQWLLKAMDFPHKWSGVIQDSASSSTLVAILSAREKFSNFHVNQYGFHKYESKMRIYCSKETHSSIVKAAKIAGIGENNVVKISSKADLSMDVLHLRESIHTDIKLGFKPICVVATLGTTGTLAFDSIDEVAKAIKPYDIWLHIDAAYAGSALILSEFSHLKKGIERADSFVFNPHKWLFTNFDCSVYFVKDEEHLVNTFEILPEYLKTSTDGKANNHCDWGIPLGRRFRSLKLWFVLRYYGLQNLQNKLRNHIVFTQWMEEKIKAHPHFELVLPRSMNLICFHLVHPKWSLDQTNRINKSLINTLNASGNIYLSHTVAHQIYTIRMVIGQTYVRQEHVTNAWSHILETGMNLIEKYS